MSQDKKKDDDILVEIKKNLKYAEEQWQDNYQRGIEDKEFVTVKGGQWEKGSIAKRTAAGKPSFEINLLRAYCGQQINTQRQNRPQAKVVPVDNGADPEIAKLIEGLIKDTEEASDFESVADVAAENAVYSGIGFIRIVTDYVSEDSFNQEPRFMMVTNPQAVYIDPQSKTFDGSDMDWAIVGEWIDKDVAEKQYGKDLSDFDMENYSNWCNDSENLVRIVEYFKREEVSDKLLLLEDGTTGLKSKLLSEFGLTEQDLDLLVQNERDTTRTVIKWYKVSGSTVLDETEFPGKYIPIIPVYGGVTFVEEKRYIFSLIHFAKDSQRLYNFWKSTEAEVLQQTQKYQDKPVASAEAVKGYEDMWQNPEKYATLFYNQVSENGEIQQAPYRMQGSTPPVAVLNAAESSKQSITDILNMHAPIMGGDTQEVSGVAIGMRQRQSETAQFHLQDNLNKSIRHGVRILIGLYQNLYTVPMVRRIIGVDGEAKTVQLFDKIAENVLADVTIGRYDVRMDTGPSYNTQREQNFQMIMQLLQMNPQLFAIIGDILLQNSPLLNAKEIAERIKKTMPPNLLGDGDQINPEQAKAQIQQMDQVIQKMTADVEKLQKLVDDKDQDRQLEMVKTQLQVEKDIKVAQINAASRSDVQELRGIVDLIKQRIDITNAPANWIQQGEGVDNYSPSQDITQIPQSERNDPPPDTIPPDMPNPPSEGFLMSEPMDQPNFAPEPDQLGESAQINNDGNMPNMEQGNGSEF